MARSLGSFHEAHRPHGWEEIATEDAAMLKMDGPATRKRSTQERELAPRADRLCDVNLRSQWQQQRIGVIES
jgi:hypothetical protein